MALKPKFERLGGKFMPKKLGFIRKVVDGCYVEVPKSALRQFGIKDYAEVIVTPNGIYIKKPQDTCIFCGSDLDLIYVYGKPVCPVCMKTLVNLKRKKEDKNSEQ